MSLTGNPDVYVKFISDMKIRAAAAMKVCAHGQCMSQLLGYCFAWLDESTLELTSLNNYFKLI